jgi:hypothetical protein
MKVVRSKSESARKTPEDPDADASRPAPAGMMN